MGYANGVPGNQLVLFLEAIDENVAEDNPVQSMDAFADSRIQPFPDSSTQNQRRQDRHLIILLVC